MQAISLSRPSETSFTLPIGRRRPPPELAPPVNLDLSWARAETTSAVARSRAYPSPPMSGSPPLPPKPAPQETGDRSQGIYHQQQQQQYHHSSASQDVHRGLSTTAHGDVRLHPPSIQAHTHQTQSPQQVQPPMRPFAPETPPERLQYGFHRAPENMPRPLPPFQPQPPGHLMAQHPYLPSPLGGPGPGPGPGPGSGPLPGPGSGPIGMQGPYPMPPRPPTQEGLPFTSPKTQRKTKGHVASACVPCKRAHLRCDAQRPCSRCISNSKEDSCVDVQHKKRGRPRLRDDRELRYDVPGRGGHSQEGSMRRPISLFNQPPASMSPGYDDTLRRSQSYRVLKSQPTEGGASSRFLERGSASDANIFPAPLSIATRPPEPAAFLAMDFEIAKASVTFAEAIGRHSVQGLKLMDVVVPSEQERVLVQQRQLQDEQVRKEPNYLPPIFGKQEEERVMQELGFTLEEMARFQLDKQDFMTFIGQDGQPRSYPVRLGLAKQDSIYFVVIQLSVAARPHGHLTPSPHTRDPRDMPYQYQPAPPQAFAAQPTPVSATFEPGRPRLGSDASGGYGGVRPGGQGMMPGLSPGLQSSYSASPSRPEYSPGLGGPGAPGATASPYQLQQSNLPQSSSTSRPPPSHLGPHQPPPQQPGYQLPPIRSSQQQQQQHQQLQQQQQQPPSWPPPRDDRSRVDIGGLIDQPDSSSSSHHLHPQ